MKSLLACILILVHYSMFAQFKGAAFYDGKHIRPGLTYDLTPLSTKYNVNLVCVTAIDIKDGSNLYIGAGVGYRFVTTSNVKIDIIAGFTSNIFKLENDASPKWFIGGAIAF